MNTDKPYVRFFAVSFGARRAKSGYSRKTLADLRAEREAVAAQSAARTAAAAPRAKPAPTKRTGSGAARSASKRRR